MAPTLFNTRREMVEANRDLARQQAEVFTLAAVALRTGSTVDRAVAASARHQLVAARAAVFAGKL